MLHGTHHFSTLRTSTVKVTCLFNFKDVGFKRARYIREYRGLGEQYSLLCLRNAFTIISLLLLTYSSCAVNKRDLRIYTKKLCFVADLLKKYLTGIQRNVFRAVQKPTKGSMSPVGATVIFENRSPPKSYIFSLLSVRGPYLFSTCFHSCKLTLSHRKTFTN